MRILSACQAAALLASPTFCLWELPGCQAQHALAVPLATSMLGALYLGAVMLYLGGSLPSMALLFLFLCIAYGVKRRLRLGNARATRVLV